MEAGEVAPLAAGDSVAMFSVWRGHELAMNLRTSTGYQSLEESRFVGLPLPGGLTRLTTYA